MQISLKLGSLLSIVFAAACLWFAIDAFMSPTDVDDPGQVSGGRSFALFWGFLAGVGIVLALVSWRLGQTRRDEDTRDSGR